MKDVYVVLLSSGQRVTHDGYLHIMGGALAFSAEPDGPLFVGYSPGAWIQFETP